MNVEWSDCNAGSGRVQNNHFLNLWVWGRESQLPTFTRNFGIISAYSLPMGSRSAIPPVVPSPQGMTAIGVFLLLGEAMACIAGATLVRHGTALDRVWALNPSAYDKLAPYGKTVGVPFLLLAGALGL